MTPDLESSLPDAATATVAATIERLGVDPQVGLTSDEVLRRREAHGSNRLAEPPERPKWKLFVDQFRSGIVAILAGAAVLAGLVGDYKDPIVIGVVLLINGVLGYTQEARASNALAALRRMLTATVRVRRDGGVAQIPVEDLVPGDVVLMEAGDRVPADARLVESINLAVDESTLTGESVPVEKDATVTSAPDAPLGERVSVVFMNTTLTRGRAEAVVTATGMSTEMGKVAELLGSAEQGSTPLQKQLHGLSRRLAAIAGVAVSAVFVLQLVQGRGFAEAALGAVALAVAAIPEGLPAVVTVTLAIGTARMARQNAIVKRLHSVETLGSTSVICSDKTGTLTLNQMTARRMWRHGRIVEISGPGYEPVGEFHHDGVPVEGAELLGALVPAALCSDAVLDGEGGIIGDPTEAALVVASAKAGIDVVSLRSARGRVGEVPFDSAHKFMATFHAEDDGVLVCVKGAPDVLLGRSTHLAGSDGPIAIDDALRRQVDDTNRELAAGGMRVLAVATRRLPGSPDIVDADGRVIDPDVWIGDLCLETLVGIVDPPRTEARDAIALCSEAGIAVKMITGDHAVTAGAIAAELGIRGEVVTGEDLSAMSDDELDARIERIGVCARVAPEHKVRVVEALQRRGHIVAMTGDGVNDAAALRRADIGVAMGITGTEVTKEAGDMVLTDDNFATIVAAVERGRTIYDNIVKFVRFQLATNMGAIISILGASIFGLPVPFTPLQVLWVNLIADGPPAMTLGVERPAPGVMGRPPVPGGAPILTSSRLVRLFGLGLVMAVTTLLLFAWARDVYSDEVALTMAFTTFVLAQMVNVFNSRIEFGTVFTRYSFTNGKLWVVVAGVVGLQVLTTVWGPMQSLFETTSLSPAQWGWCVLGAVVVLVVDEIGKAVWRWRHRSAPADRSVRADGRLDGGHRGVVE